MSAMSASPVKPVLPPTGVNVPPPVATSPPKVGMMQIPATLTIAPSKQIPATLTIAPSKPTNMNHTAMPLSLIADHKLSPQYPPQSQPGISPALQPITQPLPRTPEKPKELPVPVSMSMKPTSNGMEGLNLQNQLSSIAPLLPDVHITSVSAPLQKLETSAPVASEVQENNITLTLPENVVEPTPPQITTATIIAPSVTFEPVVEKKEDETALKPVEITNETSPQTQPTPSTKETPAITTSSSATPSTTSTTPSVSTDPPSTSPIQTSVIAPTAGATPTPPPPAEQPLPPSVSRTEVSLSHSKPEIKVATIPRQATKRKREPKVPPESPETKKEGKDEDRKSKRVRLPTQPYQSPLPELNIIAKISKSSKSVPSKAADDKLIVFYKNEFLAVRNAEGGFYVCQAMQNIYKSSPRIRIRWLSQEEGKDTYSPDFYDHTDFDCILTNLNLDKIDKEKFRLPPEEQQRTESILKRALDVEKGVSEKPPVTEEHPDGLDLSLFRDESQLKKSSKIRSKGSGKKSFKADEGDSTSNEDENETEENEGSEKKTKKESLLKTSKRKKKNSKKKSHPPFENKTLVKTTNSNNKSVVQPAKKKTETRLGSKRKSSVSSSIQPSEKKSRKSDTNSQSTDRTNKTRSVEGVVVKSRRDRRAKSRK